MTQWVRAQRDATCGAEPHCRIRAGEPMLLISGPTWTLRRCVRHAGEPVDEDVIDFAAFCREEDGSSSAGTFVRVGLVKAPWLPLRDGKALAAGSED